MTFERGVRLSSGEVVRIRVNPTDMLSILDLIDMLPIPFKENMSLAQTVSVGLSSLLATARTQGLLPEPAHFQYSERLARFRGKWEGAHKKKVEITKTIGSIGSEFQAPVFAPAHATQQERPVITKEQLEYFKELNDVKDAFMDDGVGSWSPAQEEEWKYYFKLAYPDG